MTSHVTPEALGIDYVSHGSYIEDPLSARLLGKTALLSWTRWPVGYSGYVRRIR